MVNNMSEGDEGTTTSATGSTLDNASSKQNSMQKWKGNWLIYAGIVCRKYNELDCLLK